jgi:hypothetical protein
MNTFFRTIQRWLADPDVASPAPTPMKSNELRQTLPRWTESRRARAVLVNRNPRPYWEERGWRQEGGVYQGYFQTHFGSWQGYITVSPSRRVEIYIHNPPSVLEQHPHWNCFNKREGGWYFVHPANRIADVSAGILGVEKTIIEAYEG